MVDPTRPIDNAVPPQETGARVQRTSRVADVTSAQARDQSSPTNVADSVEHARRLMEVALGEIQRADRQQVAELRAAVTEGRFEVDPQALADRLVGDALGE
ncbi:MAG: flagellar biosynthesis anti-sigma factor FlgM [Myxococcota bacterium]